jgi:hypothetical protein
MGLAIEPRPQERKFDRSTGQAHIILVYERSMKQ